MAICLKSDAALVTQVPDAADCSSSSCPASAVSDDSVPEGYLILTFDKTKRAVIKTAVFADVSDPRFADDLDDDNFGEDDCNVSWPTALPSMSCSESTEPDDRMGSTSGPTNEDVGGQTSKENQPHGNTVYTCYGEAVWVGEKDSAVGVKPSVHTVDSSHLGPAKDVWKPAQSDSQCLIRTSPISTSSDTILSISSKPSVGSDGSWSSINACLARNSLRLPVSSFNRRASLPMRLARKVNHGFYSHSDWSGSRLSLYNKHSLLDSDEAFSERSRKMLRCDECGKYYRNEYSLHHHICLKRKDVWKKGDVPSEMIDGQVMYFCPTCHKPFKWLGNLTRHFYVHTGQRFFRCDVCSKEFFSAYQVKRHMNSHTGMRFKCEICEKPFTCKYACAWHTRQHLAYVE